MAGNIKGITIEFRGDTSRLDKALRTVDKETRDIDKELRAVNKSLKFNPSNVELWRQKQQLLTDKVKETKEKLDLLKDAQKKMDTEGVDKNSAEYRDLQRDIIETESKVKHFKDELRKVGDAKFTALGNQFKGLGDKMKTAGGNMTKYVTGPILAGAGLVTKAFTEVQDGLNIVAQKTGATGTELEGMQNIARDLAKNLPVDFEQAGTAVGELNTRFGLTGDELRQLSEDYLEFAKVNGVDLNTAIDQTQKALSAFGLTAEDAPALLDQLTLAGQQSGIAVDTLTDDLVKNATAFQEMGLGIDESIGLMSQIEKSGADSDAVMQGLRRALKNAAEEGIPLDQALTDLQDTIQNGTGDMDGLTAAYDLFGKSGDQIYNAVKNGTLDFADLAQGATDASGTLDSVFDETLTPADEFKSTLNTLKDVGYEIGKTLLPMITPILETLSEKLQAISDWWNGMSPETQKLILVVGGILAAIGPLLMIIGSLISALGSIIIMGPMVGGAFTAMLGPIGLIIAAVAAAIAIGILLYKHWDQIKAKIIAIWEALKVKVGALKDAIVNIFKRIGQTIKTIVSKWFSIITWPYRKAWELIKKVAEKIKNVFKFKFKLPHIKLPHFAIKPKGWKFSDLLKGSIPSLGIEWYAKGGIFNSPSVIGVGEAGPEAVLPIEKLQNMINASNSQLAAALITALQTANAGGGETIELVVNLGGANVATEIFKLNKQGRLILEA